MANNNNNVTLNAEFKKRHHHDYNYGGNLEMLAQRRLV